MKTNRLAVPMGLLLLAVASCGQPAPAETSSPPPQSSATGESIHNEYNRRQSLSPAEKDALMAKAKAALEALRAEREGTPQARARYEQLTKQAHAHALAKYDTNHDGVLDEQERKAVRADGAAFVAKWKALMLQKYDVNRNGKLDPEERKAIHDVAQGAAAK